MPAPGPEKAGIPTEETEIHRRRPPLVRRTVRAGLTVVGAVAAAAMFAAAAAVVWLHLAVQPVLSASMQPSFGAGAAILTRQVPTSEVRAGDVIVFRPPNQSAEYAHRVATLSPDPLGPVITTRGDANPAADPWKARLVSPSVPVVVGHVPHIGRLMVAVGGREARVALVVLAGSLVLATGLRRILGARPAPAGPLARTQPG